MVREDRRNAGNEGFKRQYADSHENEQIEG